ncbi:RNA-dependent RNA polymerase [Isopteran arli-related virus OKIAV103]|uniref:RNA-directed RNA polymerase L n=1 Tax=Isopteran arli-related virus OKIAV103 TaxID=2746356 RepID=A0ABX6QU47_9MONO|nr:RNA-dependent RNA polymerase [Isopteran arli-related virus OKIAV103]QMP82349.1 RNA-dependent RNA polymerase [Isopteran arli-related virus OKIAV103]
MYSVESTVEYDYDIDEEFRVRYPTQKIPDSHLQSPIRSVYRYLILDNPAKWPRFLSSCLQNFPVDKSQIIVESETCYGQLLSCVYHYDSSSTLKWVQDNYPECCSAVKTFIETLCDKLEIRPIRTRMSGTEDDIMLISFKVLWDEVRSVMQEKRLGSDSWVEIHNNPSGIQKMHVCALFAVFKLVSDDSHWYVFDYDQVMMIADTVASRVFTLIYNDILPEGLPGKLHTHIIQSCYRVYDEELSVSGNIAYIKIARWESLCMAVMLKLHDRLKRSNSYFDWLEDEIEVDSDTSSAKIIKLLLKEDLSVEMLAEMHGLYRHWGHPTVQEELGCEKVKYIAQNRPMPNMVILNKMSGALKRQFISSFIGKHGRWPRIMNIEALKGKPIHDLVVNQSKILNLHSPSYPLEDWGLIRFGKEFDFDYHLDYTDMLEDRSISVKRSEIRSLYSSDALGYKPSMSTTDRRVLKEALKRPTVDIKAICNLVQKNRIPKEWKIIIVHAKERELKIAPRLFAMMTFEMRLYYSVTEANIAEFIFKYFPQQTMTLDEADLSKRLYTLTGSVSDTLAVLSALLGIDFSSWNICWTFPSTADVFQFLDDLFGTPGLYLATHQFFEQSLIALASHHNPPQTLIGKPSGQPLECNELWYNHLGGFEGLRQKGWTLCTIGLLLLVEATTGLKSYIIGQGDNQVCKLMLPLPENCDSAESYIYSDQEEISSNIDKFIQKLQEYASEIGLHVKKDETWVGMDILAYGKEILYKGAYMPQGLKRISRLLTDVNEIYPTLHTKVSTLQTAGMACSQKSYDIITPYFLCTVEALMVIARDIGKMVSKKELPKNTTATTETILFKEFLLCLSSDIGCCPILSLIAFLYRGHPDPLTTHLTSLRILSDKVDIAKRMYIWMEKRHYRVGRGDCELLVSNPCALNIDSPETISTKIRRDLENSLLTYTKNRDLKEIFHAASQSADAKLFKYLINIDPCHPRVAHEIFRNTVTGSKLSFLSKFSNTRTTQAIFSEKTDSRRMMSEISTLERQMVTHWIHLYKSALCMDIRNAKLKCPTLLAQELRDDTWSVATNGRKIEGVTIPHPCHQFVVNTSDNFTDHYETTKEKIIFMIPKKNSKSLISTRGPYPAFVGSVTREKRSGKMYSIPLASRPLKSAERLIQLRNWMTTEGDQVYNYLTSLSESRTNVPTNILEDITAPIIGGSVTHRLDDHVTKRGTLHNFRPNITTHIYYTTDTMGRFSRGLSNFNMHYQGCIHMGMSVIQCSVVQSDTDLNGYLSLQYSGDCCEERLDDFTLRSNETAPGIKTSTRNPLLYASIDVLPFQSTPQKTNVVKFITPTRPPEAIAFILFSRCLASNSLYQIGFVEQSNPLVGSVGVAEILGCGLQQVLYHLAKYIYLYLPYEESAASEFFHSLSPRVFNDIASICLMPEVLPEISEILGFSAVPDMFCNKDVVCNLIKRIVEKFLYDFHTISSEAEKEAYQTMYYPISHIGLQRILSMWAKQIWIISMGRICLDPLISHILKVSPTSVYMPNSVFVDSMISSLISSGNNQLLTYICKLCPLRLSSLPPHNVARSSRIDLRLKSFRRSSKKRELKSEIQKFVGCSRPYVLTLDCSLVVREAEIKEMTKHKTLTLSLDKQRLDQTYRIIGPVSTSYLKVYEIFMKEGWTFEFDAITLAEGEGSIAELLIRLGSRHLYYNSLIDRTKLVEQRAPGLVPACTVPFSEQVKMGALTAFTGGDLCDNRVLKEILSYIPQSEVDIVTCDAEASGNFSPGISNKILLAWAAVCIVSKSKYGLLKTFCHNSDVLANIIGTCLLVFDNVKTVVPCFSSNETYEVYLVCDTPHHRVSADTIIGCHDQGLLIKCMSSETLRRPLMLLKTERVIDHPFQDDLTKEVIKLWSECMSLGFEDNLASNLNRITLFNSIYNGEDIIQWLNSARDLAYNRAVRVLHIQSASYYGDPITAWNPTYIPKHHVLHTQIESYLTCMINCNIVIEIIGKKRHEILEVINEYLSGDHQLKSGNDVLYTLPLSAKVWKKAYLKNVCRIWGHWYYQKCHTCSYKWK